MQSTEQILVPGLRPPVHTTRVTRRPLIRSLRPAAYLAAAALGAAVTYVLEILP